MLKQAKTTLRCTDNLEDPNFVEELRGRFHATNGGDIYDLEIGQLVKGAHRAAGYFAINYRGRYYMKHRLVYALLNGPFRSHIDHIDGDVTNNSISNLRLCSQGLNVANAKMRRDNTSGYMGVIWHKASNKWQSQTMFDQKRVHIGLFDCKKEAGLAYNYKLAELFGHQCTFNKVFEDHPDTQAET